MKIEFTSTIKTTSIIAYVVPTGTKKPVEKPFVLIGKLSEEQAEKALEKRGKKMGFRLAYVDSFSHEEKLYPLSIELFLRYAVKLSRRGENGRTRDPLVTRTVQSTNVLAYVVHKGTKRPVTQSFVLDGFLTEEEAEKALEKQGKKMGFRLAYVDSMSKEEAVYEMPARFFVMLSELYTKYGEEADTKLKEALDEMEANSNDSNSDSNSDSDSDSDKA